MSASSPDAGPLLLTLRIELRSSLADVDPVAWDALCPPGDPFSTHAFLSALEDSGAVSPRAGWRARHLLAWQGETLVGAVPLYEKDHSYGEYIFDFGWAQACAAARVPYYPKLVAAIPFTPATGGRLLVGAHPQAEVLEDALVQALLAAREQLGCHSLHLLFVRRPVHERLSGARGLIGRTTMQFHWENAGPDGAPYADEEAWLATFRSKVRKETRRERRRPAERGAEVVVLEGAEIDASAWAALRHFYLDTVHKRGGEAYLPAAFFRLAAERLQHLSLAVMARRDGAWVAGSLCFHRGGELFGRYWGCLPGDEGLHFELCYHRPISLCIERGWRRFEAGAQGMHKLRRGLLPAPTYSLHALRHPGLAAAVAEAVAEERAAVLEQVAGLRRHGPHHRADPDEGALPEMDALQGVCDE
jgi:predicted N-acyltransferase